MARPHVFQALRMVMKGRDKDFDMAWSWPSHLMDVTAPDSDFMRVYEEFKVNGMLAVTLSDCPAHCQGGGLSQTPRRWREKGYAETRNRPTPQK